ncbi:MAG TPA: carbohydrate ABC transporter permease [Firmicutes bacterium]|nr:carbohydrate ABC transporter permease [Bacillota bacterium]
MTQAKTAEKKKRRFPGKGGSSGKGPAPAAPGSTPPEMPRVSRWVRLKRWARSVVSHPRLLGKYVVRLLTYLILLDLAYVFLYPFLYMIVTSLKTNADLYDPTVNWIPHTLKFANYTLAYHAIDFSQNIWNSVIYTVFGTLGHVLSCAFIGYGFARYEFRGKKLLFGILLLAIIIPPQAMIVPSYLMYSNMGLLNTYLPVILPTLFGFGLRGGLFVFIFRQFFQSLPKELEEAARIDGCGFMKTYVRIVLPISKAVLLVTLVLSMVWHWNDYYEPQIYASRPGMEPLPVALQTLIPLLESPAAISDLIQKTGLVDMEAVVNNAVFMAATFMCILPILVIYAFLQKQFMQGVERTGLVE